MKSFIDKHALKFIIGFVMVFLIRLLPFRPPNVEPVMTTMMPFAKRFGPLSGFLFAFLAIVLFDLFTMRVGIWTLITALAYGSLGIAAYYFFKNRESRPRNYVIFAVFGTLFYDAVTGLTIGPLFWGQPFMVALTGQIPFTILHLVSNVTFAAVVSPLLYKWVVQQEDLSLTRVRASTVHLFNKFRVAR